MNKQITYTDVYSQLEKLKSQNLIISDEAFAISALSRYGYSNLIKSYREPYIISTMILYIIRMALLLSKFYLYLF